MNLYTLRADTDDIYFDRIHEANYILNAFAKEHKCYCLNNKVLLSEEERVALTLQLPYGIKLV